MKVYAKFIKTNIGLFRLDTRIYFSENPVIENGICIGAVVGKNPGSATPSEDAIGKLFEVELNNDKFLPNVYNRFKTAFEVNHISIDPKWYIQVWNLFYLVDNNLYTAKNRIENSLDLPKCQSEENKVNFLWYLWGGYDAEINSYKERFYQLNHKGFFYNNYTKEIEEGTPKITICARHTQGMKKAPIQNFLNSKIKMLVTNI